VVGIGDIYGFSEAVLGGFFQGIVEPALHHCQCMQSESNGIVQTSWAKCWEPRGPSIAIDCYGCCVDSWVLSKPPRR